MDHKVHCHLDNVTDYCRRDKNDGWEFMRQKRRESVQAQVGKILAGAWESAVYERIPTVKRIEVDFTTGKVKGNEFSEIERYLKGETYLLGHLDNAREEMRDGEG